MSPHHLLLRQSPQVPNLSTTSNSNNEPNTCDTGYSFYRCRIFIGCCKVDPCFAAVSPPFGSHETCPDARPAKDGTPPVYANDIGGSTTRLEATQKVTVIKSGTVTTTMAMVTTSANGGGASGSGAIPTMTSTSNGSAETSGVLTNNNEGSQGSPEFPTSIVAGSVIGALVLMAILAWIGWWCVKRRRRQQNGSVTGEQDGHIEVTKEEKEAQSITGSGSGTSGSTGRAISNEARRFSSATANLMRMSLGRMGRGDYDEEVRLGPPPGGPVWDGNDKETGVPGARCGGTIPKSHSTGFEELSALTGLRGQVENPRGGLFEEFGGIYRSPRPSVSNPSFPVSPLTSVRSSALPVSPLSPSKKSAIPTASKPPATIPELASVEILEAEGSAPTRCASASPSITSSHTAIGLATRPSSSGDIFTAPPPTPIARAKSMGSLEGMGVVRGKKEGAVGGNESGGNAPCRADLNATATERIRGVHAASWSMYGAEKWA